MRSKTQIDLRQRYDAFMTFFALIVALLLEQVYPVQANHPVHAYSSKWLKWVRRQLDAPQQKLAPFWAWSVSTVLPSLAVAVSFHWVAAASTLLAWIYFCVLAYATVGFRQFSHHFSAIRLALQEGRRDEALQILKTWQPDVVISNDSSMWLVQVLRMGILEAQRHVLGVIAALALGAALGLGPAGAVFYRLCGSFLRHSGNDHANHGVAQDDSIAMSDTLYRWGQTAWHWVNWLPTRLTLFAFAVVGRFEDVLAVWREHSHRERTHNNAMLLDAASAVLGVRLDERPVDEPDALHTVQLVQVQESHLDAWIGLAWRGVMLWIVVLGMLTLARWF